MTKADTPVTMMKRVAQIVPSLIVVGILGAGWLAVHEINSGDEAETPSGETVSDGDSESQIVTLTEGKSQAANLRVETAARHVIQHTHTIPGRIRYNETRHIDMKAPVEGIVAEVAVKPGDRVDEGQLLAVISSPEIGRARSDVLRLQAELELVERTQARVDQLTSNLESLFRALDEGRDTDEIDAQFAEAALGTYRQELMSAYSKLELVKKNSDSLRPLAESGAVAGRTLREIDTERQVALADYRSTREQVAFEVKKLQMQAEIDTDDATRKLKIAELHRDSLLGYSEENVTGQTAEALARIEVHAPFNGTIETCSYARSERINQGDSLFILADTTSLYVAADIRENDWPAVSLQPQQEIVVTVPAIPDREFTASVLYIGREVTAETNAVPLVATIDNSEGLLRPGMFVRVVVPMGSARQALAVKPESILMHNDHDFVFVALDQNKYQRIDVTTGIDSDQWVEITGGLEPGQEVVEDGAFLLKSELLLEGEEE
ncbi:MAG: efflux RND transporter periplasmic adaptor subunit [Planctomycetaceae bacterium]|nr:efflux RND transporter periplasmic adaptor subunit [Planctomycetaceae bacterium]